VVRWSVEHVLSASPDEVLVVVGHEGDAVRAALDGLTVRVVQNHEWSEGIGSSLRAGIAAVGAGTEAAMIALGDQPSVEAGVVSALLTEYAEAPSAIMAPSYRGERGHPVIFAASLFPELLAIRGDRGAREVIARDASRISLVRIDAASPPDVDTVEELQALRG
jgi:molybdenum cofactor cytidylyltransferase